MFIETILGFILLIFFMIFMGQAWGTFRNKFDYRNLEGITLDLENNEIVPHKNKCYPNKQK